MKCISNGKVFGGFSDRHDGDLSFYLFGNGKSSKIWNQLEVVKNESLRKPVFLSQAHGNDIVEVTDPNSEWEIGRADALVTSLNNIPIGVFSADCLPVLLWSSKTIAAIHAGWKGTLANISGKVAKFIAGKDQVAPSVIKASLGPCIDLCCLEMGEEVYSSFVNENSEYNQFFTKTNKWHLNLKELNKFQLNKAGLISENITKEKKCTYCHEKDFFSYRRQKKRNGSMFSFIVRKSRE